jgi:hypothetical protein
MDDPSSEEPSPKRDKLQQELEEIEAKHHGEESKGEEESEAPETVEVSTPRNRGRPATRRTLALRHRRRPADEPDAAESSPARDDSGSSGSRELREQQDDNESKSSHPNRAAKRSR